MLQLVRCGEITLDLLTSALYLRDELAKLSRVDLIVLLSQHLDLLSPGDWFIKRWSPVHFLLQSFHLIAEFPRINGSLFRLLLCTLSLRLTIIILTCWRRKFALINAIEDITQTDFLVAPNSFRRMHQVFLLHRGQPLLLFHLISGLLTLFGALLIDFLEGLCVFQLRGFLDFFFSCSIIGVEAELLVDL